MSAGGCLRVRAVTFMSAVGVGCDGFSSSARQTGTRDLTVWRWGRGLAN